MMNSNATESMEQNARAGWRQHLERFDSPDLVRTVAHYEALADEAKAQANKAAAEGREGRAQVCRSAEALQRQCSRVALEILAERGAAFGTTGSHGA